MTGITVEWGLTDEKFSQKIIIFFALTPVPLVYSNAHPYCVAEMYRLNFLKLFLIYFTSSPDWFLLLFFTAELDNMSSTERISFLQKKLQEIRKYYMSLKSEVASIDRRRKRLKKKEREGKFVFISFNNNNLFLDKDN